uniref:Uncharacterized protein n=1 Tax=Heterorhabditis bacteriophora TaxID=37862 RepID=A0A1I7WID6_HETBA
MFFRYILLALLWSNTIQCSLSQTYILYSKRNCLKYN